MESYTHCYFAFLDILGFKSIVEKKSCSEIVKVFDELKTKIVVSRVINEELRIPVIAPENIHYYIMSDSICIYIDDSINEALPILTFLCMNLQVRLLCLDTPIFVRGSISRGEIYAKDGILFGPALVDAYQRSENLAHVPRIIIPANLIEEITDRHESAMLKGFTYMDYDGFYVNYYIDYFFSMDAMLPYRERVYDHIDKMMNTAITQSIRDKYLYIKSRIDYLRSQEATRESPNKE